jgi:hypothetical protein
MTMRQVRGLLQVIGKADLVDLYYAVLSNRLYQGQDLPSLEQFLFMSLNNGEEPQGFDEKTDKLLEEQALKRLYERRVKNG